MTAQQPNAALRGAIDAIGSAANSPRPYDQLASLRLIEPRPHRRRSRMTVFAAAALLASAIAAVILLRPGDESDHGTISPGPVASPAVVPDTTAVPPVATQSVVYPAQQGDTVSDVAYLLCTTPELLAAANAWPDGTAHVLHAGERVAVPLGSCIQGGGLPDQGAARRLEAVPVLGDVDAAGIAEALLSGGAPVSDFSVPATGLARPDYFDWTARVAEILPTLADGAPVVVAIGAADAQSIVEPDGTQILPGTPEWTSEYMRRIGVFADAVLAAGHPVIWVVPSPPVSTYEWAQRMTEVADAITHALEARPGAMYVNSWDALRGPDGDAASVTALDATGAAVVVRADGQITPAGDQLLADRVSTALRLLGFDSERPVPPSAASTSSTSVAVTAPTLPATSTAATTAAGGVSVVDADYTVQAGDYLAAIANRYKADLDDLVAYNDWPDGPAHPLFPGDVIKIPPGFTVPDDVPPPTGTSPGGT